MFFGLLASGCGATPGDGAGSPQPPVVLSIESALASEPGSYVSVRGSLLATGGAPEQKILLASGLAESYPPQAGQPSLSVEGLDLDDIVGLTSTTDQPGVSPATWSDFSVVLTGTISDGVLKVKDVPEVFEASAGGVRVRFSVPNGPVKATESVWWTFDVGGEGSTPLRVTFSSGLRAEVVLSQGGVEVPVEQWEVLHPGDRDRHHRAAGLSTCGTE